MKKIQFVIAFIAIAMLFSACEQTLVQEEVKEKQPIIFHHYFSGTLSGGIDEMVTRYNDNQMDYHLNAVPIDHEAYKVNILNSLENGRPADLNSYWAGERTRSIISYLEPIDDVFEAHNLEDVFPKTLLDSASLYEGKYYLIPLTQHYVTFYYNKDVFDKYGLRPPQTWDDFIAICNTLKEEGITPIGLGAKDRWPAQFWFDYLLLRTAGFEYRAQLMKDEMHYTDPEVVRAVELWKSLIDAGYFNPDASNADWADDIIEPLLDGEYGMTLMGTWFSGAIAQSDHEGNYDVFSFPIIDQDVPLVALGPVDGIVIGKDALNKEGAKDAIVQFTEVNNQVEMALGSGAFVPNKKTPESIYDTYHLKMLDDIKRSKHWAFNYDLATSPDTAEKGLNFFIEFLSFPEAYKLLLEELDEAIRR